MRATTDIPLTSGTAYQDISLISHTEYFPLTHMVFPPHFVTSAIQITFHQNMAVYITVTHIKFLAVVVAWIASNDTI